MEIESPAEFMNAIKILMVQMNRPQRKQFLLWVKRLRTEYDFKYPEGYKIEEKKNVSNEADSLKPIITTAEPSILVPDYIKPSSEDSSSSTPA